jgi:cell division protein FtsB
MVLAAKHQVAYEERWEALPSVEQPLEQPIRGKRRRRLRVHPMIFLFALAVFIVALTALGINQKIKAIELEYRLQALEADLKLVQREGQQLQLKVEQLQSLSHIDTEARSRLGMVEPQGAKVLVMLDWDDRPSELAAAKTDARAVLAKQGHRLWTAIYQWVGARLPALGTAEAGLLDQ